MEGRDGHKYKYNNGVFKIRYQGLLFCDGNYIVSEGLLVYSKSNTDRAVAEVELARFYLETEEFPQVRKKPFYRVIFTYNIDLYK